MEQENSAGVLGQKIDQVLGLLNELKDTVRGHSNELTDIKIEIALQKQADTELKENLKEMEKRSDRLKWQVVVCIFSVVSTVIGAIILTSIGLR